MTTPDHLDDVQILEVNKKTWGLSAGCKPGGGERESVQEEEEHLSSNFFKQSCRKASCQILEKDKGDKSSKISEISVEGHKV